MSRVTYYISRSGNYSDPAGYSDPVYTLQNFLPIPPLIVSCIGLGRVGSVSWWVGLDWVTKWTYWQLCLPRRRLLRSAYRCSAPAVWNSLLKTVVSVTVLKSRLKTFLFPRLYLFSFLSSTLPGVRLNTGTINNREILCDNYIGLARWQAVLASE